MIQSLEESKWQVIPASPEDQALTQKVVSRRVGGLLMQAASRHIEPDGQRFLVVSNTISPRQSEYEQVMSTLETAASLIQGVGLQQLEDPNGLYTVRSQLTLPSPEDVTALYEEQRNLGIRQVDNDGQVGFVHLHANPANGLGAGILRPQDAVQTHYQFH